MRIVDQSIPNMQFTTHAGAHDHSGHEPNRPLRPDASRHLARPVLPARVAARRTRSQRDEALIGAIGASDLLQLDGVGGGSTLTSKVAIVSRSAEPGCDVDYLFAQVGVGQRSVDTRPNCGNMLSGVGAVRDRAGAGGRARDGETTVRVFNVNTRSRIDVTVQTPRPRVSYEGEHAHRRRGRHRRADPAELPRRLGRGHRLGVPDRPAHRRDRRRGSDLHRRRDAADDRAGRRPGRQRPRVAGGARRRRVAARAPGGHAAPAPAR